MEPRKGTNYDKQALVLVIARAFYLVGLRSAIAPCCFAFACALSGHSAGQTSHADYTGLHCLYSGVMRALLAWPPKWRASSRQPEGVGRSHVVAIGGGGKETREARITNKNSESTSFAKDSDFWSAALSAIAIHLAPTAPHMAAHGA
jgi:hypothetical protein